MKSGKSGPSHSAVGAWGSFSKFRPVLSVSREPFTGVIATGMSVPNQFEPRHVIGAAGLGGGGSVPAGMPVGFKNGVSSRVGSGKSDVTLAWNESNDRSNQIRLRSSVTKSSQMTNTCPYGPVAT